MITSAILAKTNQDTLFVDTQGIYSKLGALCDWFLDSEKPEGSLLKRTLTTLDETRKLIVEWFKLLWNTIHDACKAIYGKAKALAETLKNVLLSFADKVNSHEFPLIKKWIASLKAMWEGKPKTEIVNAEQFTDDDIGAELSDLSTKAHNTKQQSDKKDKPKGKGKEKYNPKEGGDQLEDLILEEISSDHLPGFFNYLDADVHPEDDESTEEIQFKPELAEMLGTEVDQQGISKVLDPVYDVIVDVFSFIGQILSQFIGELSDFKSECVLLIKNAAHMYFIAERGDLAGSCKRLINYIISFLNKDWRPFQDQADKTDFNDVAIDFTGKCDVIVKGGKIRSNEIEALRDEAERICKLCKALAIHFPREHSFYNQQEKKFAMLYRQAAAKYCSGQPRMKPVTMTAFGGSGTGKSRAVRKICKHIDYTITSTMKTAGISDECHKRDMKGNADIFSVNCLEEKQNFDAGCNDPRFYEMNELYTPTDNSINNEWSQKFMNLAGDNPVLLDTPFEDKGTKYFNAPFLFATSNAKGHHVPFKDKTAYYRRIDFDFTCTRGINRAKDGSIISQDETFFAFTKPCLAILYDPTKRPHDLMSTMFKNRKITPADVFTWQEVRDMMALVYISRITAKRVKEKREDTTNSEISKLAALVPRTVVRQGIEGADEVSPHIRKAQNVVRLLRVGNVISHLPNVAISKAAFQSYMAKLFAFEDFTSCDLLQDDKLPPFVHDTDQHGLFNYAVDMRWFQDAGFACQDYVDGEGVSNPPALAHKVVLMVARLKDDCKNMHDFNGPNKWTRRHAERDYIAKTMFPTLSIAQKRTAALAAQDPAHPGSGWLPFSREDVPRAQKVRHSLYLAHKEKAEANAARVREQNKAKKAMNAHIQRVEAPKPSKKGKGKGMKSQGVRQNRSRKAQQRGYKNPSQFVDEHGIGADTLKLIRRINRIKAEITSNRMTGDEWYNSFPALSMSFYRKESRTTAMYHEACIKSCVQLYYYLVYHKRIEEKEAVRFVAIIYDDGKPKGISMTFLDSLLKDGYYDVTSTYTQTCYEQLALYAVVINCDPDRWASNLSYDVFRDIVSVVDLNELIQVVSRNMLKYGKPNTSLYYLLSRTVDTLPSHYGDMDFSQIPCVAAFMGFASSFSKTIVQFDQSPEVKVQFYIATYAPNIIWGCVGIMTVSLVIDALIAVGNRMAKWFGVVVEPEKLSPDDPTVKKILSDNGVEIQGDEEYEKRKAEKLAQKNLAMKALNARSITVAKQGLDMEGFNNKVLRNAYVCLTPITGVEAGTLLFLEGTVAVMNLHVYESLDRLQLLCYMPHIGPSVLQQTSTRSWRVLHKEEERDLVFLNIPGMRNHSKISHYLQEKRFFGLCSDAAWVTYFDHSSTLGMVEPISNFVSNSLETIKESKTNHLIKLKSTYTWPKANPGRCGTPVAVLKSGKCMIEGIHSFGQASKSFGVCYPIFSEDWQIVVKKLQAVPGSDGFSVSLADQETGVYSFSVDKHCYETPIIKDACGQTCFAPTPFADLLFEGGAPKIPANLTPKAYRLALAKEKVTMDNPLLHDEVFDIAQFAQQEIMHKFLPVDASHVGRLQTLSFEAALYSDDISLNAFDFKTAEGIRCKLNKIPKKQVADPDSEATAALKKVVMDKVEAFKNGDFTLQLNSDCLKDEPRDLERVAAMKTRLFNVTDFVDNILIKMALGALIAKFKNLLTWGPSMCGINPGCTMWSYIYSLFVNEKLVCSDFSGWDHLSEKWIGIFVYPWLESFYGKGTFASRFACWAYLGATQAIRFNRGLGRRLDRGGSSGNWGTTFFNTINNHVMHCVTLISLSMKHGYDWRLTLSNFKHVLYSDDNISAGPLFWTPLAVSGEMKRLFGANLTSTDKGELTEHCTSIEHADFLCRMFRRDKGVVYCPLNRVSMMSQLYFVRTTKSTRNTHHVLSQLQINLDNVARELIEYPEEERLEIGCSIQEFLNSNNISAQFNWLHADPSRKLLIY